MTPILLAMQVVNSRHDQIPRSPFVPRDQILVATSAHHRD
jgi:hypothetical protein